MNEFTKKTLFWFIVVIGKILLAMTVWNLNKISNNLDSLNDNVNHLITLTATQGIEISSIKERVDKHDNVFEQLLKYQYEKKHDTRTN